MRHRRRCPMHHHPMRYRWNSSSMASIATLQVEPDRLSQIVGRIRHSRMRHRRSSNWRWTRSCARTAASSGRLAQSCQDHHYAQQRGELHGCHASERLREEKLFEHTQTAAAATCIIRRAQRTSSLANQKLELTYDFFTLRATIRLI